MQKDVWVSWTRPCSLCWQCLLYSPCIYIFYPLMLYLRRWKFIVIIIWHAIYAISRSKQTLLLPDKLQSQWDLPTKRYLEGHTCKVPFRVAFRSQNFFSSSTIWDCQMGKTVYNFVIIVLYFVGLEDYEFFWWTFYLRRFMFYTLKTDMSRFIHGLTSPSKRSLLTTSMLCLVVANILEIWGFVCFYVPYTYLMRIVCT